MRKIKIFRIFLLVLIIIGVGLLLTQKYWVPPLVNKILSSEGSYTKEITPSKKAGETAPRISITAQKIKEENFSGTKPKISGTIPLAIKMREYIEAKIAEFKGEADADVPGMREKFGGDSPLSTYTIDINSKYIKGEKTESIVTDVYSYTGGAHGGTVYKVITAGRTSGKVLALSIVIKKDKQSSFTEFVKKQLNEWRPDGSDASPVFTDEVKDLTFNSFTNWSMDDKNLIIYFDQNAIGPGALGAVPFPISLSKIQDFLVD